MRGTFKSIFLALLLFTQGVHVVQVQAVAISGMEWNQDNDPFSTTNFIQLLWDGANLLPREEHTAIWRYNPRQQTGYYAVAWHSPNDGVWDFGNYSYGTHPYPATDCSVDGSGNAQTGSGSSGTFHCWEEAGLSSGGSPHDYLSAAGVSPGKTVVKSQWYVQIRRVRLMTSGPHSGEWEHRYIPDFLGDPTFEIIQYVTSIGPAGSTPAFYIGVSDWSGSAAGGGSEETLGGKIRGIQLYDIYLSDADVATEAANQFSNTPQTVAGIANVWYMNQNPIPTDVADKSGAGHNPTWGNANRPIQWDSTLSAPRWGVFGDNDMMLLKVGF